MDSHIASKLSFLPEGPGMVVGTRAFNNLVRLIGNMASRTLDISVNPQGGIQLEYDRHDFDESDSSSSGSSSSGSINPCGKDDKGASLRRWHRNPQSKLEAPP